VISNAAGWRQRPRASRGSATGLSRREFLAGLLAAGACAGCGDSSEVAAIVAGSDEARRAFPESVPLYRADFENWSGEIGFRGLRTFAPRSPEDVVDVANWAARNGYALRARGMMHNWSPLALDPRSGAQSPVVLADTTRYLDRMELADLPMPAVRVQCGATLDALTEFLERAGYGFTSMPTTGNITIGGALAVDAHGTAVPAIGEAKGPGQTYGSLSNRVLALTAVVWDPLRRRYVLRDFERGDREIGALLTSLGRAFLTEVTLMVEPDMKLRCVSHTDIPHGELFGPPGSGRTLASFLDDGGRVEALWFAFTSNPWLQVWTVSPDKPAGSRAVSSPYNYPFIHNFPQPVVELAAQCVTGAPAAALLVGQASFAVLAAGLTATLTQDLWGNSRNVLLWVKPDTLREHRSSWVVTTRRDQAQRVVSEFITAFRDKRDAYQAQGRFPANMPVEVRISGLDDPSDTGLPDAQPALLSAIAQRADHPDWDTGVWMALSTMPGTPYQYAFAREMEQWAFDHYRGDYAAVRPEWARGWAYDDAAAWADPVMLGSTIPAAFPGWEAAMAQLRELDPAGIYQNDFLERLTA